MGRWTMIKHEVSSVSNCRMYKEVARHEALAKSMTATTRLTFTSWDRFPVHEVRCSHVSKHAHICQLIHASLITTNCSSLWSYLL